MNINWLNVCTVGLEVLLAVGTGIAVFAGLYKVTTNNKTQSQPQQPQQPTNNFTAPAEPSQNSNPAPVQGQTPVVVTENKFATGLRATQNCMEKIISILGALSVAVESIGAIFGKTSDRGYSQQTPWYGGGYNNNSCWYTQTPPSYMGPGLRQVTPFIQEMGYYPSR